MHDRSLRDVVHRGYNTFVYRETRYARYQADTAFAFECKHFACCGACHNQDCGVIDGLLPRVILILSCRSKLLYDSGSDGTI